MSLVPVVQTSDWLQQTLDLHHYHLQQSADYPNEDTTTSTSLMHEALALKRIELELSQHELTFKHRMTFLSYVSPCVCIMALSALLSYALVNLSKEVVLKITSLVTVPERVGNSLFNYFTSSTAYQSDRMHQYISEPIAEEITRMSYLGMSCIFVLAFLLLYGMYQFTTIHEIAFWGCKVKRRRMVLHSGARKTKKIHRTRTRDKSPERVIALPVQNSKKKRTKQQQQEQQQRALQ